MYRRLCRAVDLQANGLSSKRLWGWHSWLWTGLAVAAVVVVTGAVDVDEEAFDLKAPGAIGTLSPVILARNPADAVFEDGNTFESISLTKC
jgi:hypothetical protein